MEKNIQVQSIAEIGVFEGQASKMFRYLFPDAHLTLIDPWKLYSEYLSSEAGPISQKAQDFETAHQRVKDYFKDDPKCKILRMTSVEAAHAVGDSKFDLVFIDGNHSYEYVKEDIQLWLPKVRPGGILAGHDYEPDFPGVVQAVNEVLAGDFETGIDVTWFHSKK